MVIETAVRPGVRASVRQGSDSDASVGEMTSPSGVVLRRVRRDALPEEIQYRDDGCDIHAHCLTCPLPRCRYDEPGGVRAMLNTYRDQQIVALRGDGAPVDQIADRYRLSRRTVFRILERTAAVTRSGGNGHRMSSGEKRKERNYA